MQLSQKLPVGIPAPIGVVHRLVPSGANANREFPRRFRAGEHRRNPVRNFHPAMRRFENFRAAAQAMQNLAEKPFAAIGASAFRQILGTDFAGQFGNLRRFRYARVVFPQPRHRRRVFRKPFVERQRLSVAIHRHRRASRRVHADSRNLSRHKTSGRFSRCGNRPTDRHLRSLHVIGRMLPRQIGIMRKNDALLPVLISPRGIADLAPIGRVHNPMPERSWCRNRGQSCILRRCAAWLNCSCRQFSVQAPVNLPYPLLSLQFRRCPRNDTACRAGNPSPGQSICALPVSGPPWLAANAGISVPSVCRWRCSFSRNRNPWDD